MDKDETRKLLARILPAAASCSFYRKKYGIESLDGKEAENYIAENFDKLPVLTRSELDELRSSSNSDGYSKILFTGGTSGVSGAVSWFDDDILENSKRMAHVFKAAGQTEGTVTVSTVSTSTSIYGTWVEYLCKINNAEILQFNDAQPYNFRTIESIAKKTKITALFGTPMGLIGLTKDKKLMDSLKDLKFIVVSGAVLADGDAETLHEKFGCRLFDVLGSTEGGMYSFREYGEPGFNLSNNVCHIDIIDGQAVTTCLVNRRMPMIRYASGDKGKFEGGRYILEGRITKTFYIGGTKVSLELFREILSSLEIDAAFQVVLDRKSSPTKLTLNIVCKEQKIDMEKISETILDNNLALFNKIEKHIVEFDIAFVSELIGLTNRGKYKNVIEI